MGLIEDNEHICITSSKAGAGLKTLVARLKKMGIAGEKKYIHVVGVTNVGKSSVLNALRVETKKCS